MARKSELPSLAGTPWLTDGGLQYVMAMLSIEGGEFRVAGGAVRNSLLGLPVADIDLATTVLPEDVMRLAKSAGLGVHPTGIEHGTVTVVKGGQSFEVTTLRRDVATDGRHAVVAFTMDWEEDAGRRDFTMNALYCDANGKVFDYVGGYADLMNRRVRFVGFPGRRIEEDYLRILRFFRFHASYGKGPPDEAGLRACIRLKAGLAQLSAERVRQEMLKLLAARRAASTLRVMAKAGILQDVLPHTTNFREIQRLPQDALLRLYVLAKDHAGLKDRLRLSNAETARLEALASAPELSPALSVSEQRRLLYQLGAQTWADASRLAWARSSAALDDKHWKKLVAEPLTWSVPSFPVTGADLLARGFRPGVALGAALHQMENWWLARDFKPGKQELLALVSPEGDI